MLTDFPAMDLFGPEICRNPYPIYARLRRDHPIYYDQAKNFWLFSRHAHVAQVLRDGDAFSSALPPHGKHPLLAADGPAHARLRRKIAPLFAAQRVRELTGLIRLVADRLVAPIADRRSCELISDVGAPLPATVVAALLGIELDRAGDIARWSDSIAHCLDPSPSSNELAILRRHRAECASFVGEFIRTLKRTGSDHLLVSAMQGDAVDEPITHEDMTEIVILLIIAGNITTTNLLANSMLVMVQFPEWHEILRRDPQKIPAFVDEVLRYDSPIQRIWRRNVRETCIADVLIPAEARLLLLVGSANHDEDVFPEADRVQLCRAQNHLAFGWGPHFCLGAQIGRIEVAAALECFLKYLPPPSRADPEKQIEYVPSLLEVRGPRKLDLVFSY